VKDDLNDEVLNGIPKALIPSNGMLGWGNYKFLKLDRKTYHIELSLKMFICKKYNGRGATDVNVICNGWK